MQYSQLKNLSQKYIYFAKQSINPNQIHTLTNTATSVCFSLLRYKKNIFSIVVNGRWFESCTANSRHANQQILLQFNKKNCIALIMRIIILHTVLFTTPHTHHRVSHSDKHIANRIKKN